MTGEGSRSGLRGARSTEDGYPELSKASFDKVGHIFELSLPTVTAGALLRLDLEGPLEHAVFLGISPGYEKPEAGSGKREARSQGS